VRVTVPVVARAAVHDVGACAGIHEVQAAPGEDLIVPLGALEMVALDRAEARLAVITPRRYRERGARRVRIRVVSPTNRARVAKRMTFSSLHTAGPLQNYGPLYGTRVTCLRRPCNAFYKFR
jgi:hypothetical protein